MDLSQSSSSGSDDPLGLFQVQSVPGGSGPSGFGLPVPSNSDLLVPGGSGLIPAGGASGTLEAVCEAHSPSAHSLILNPQTVDLGLLQDLMI